MMKEEAMNRNPMFRLGVGAVAAAFVAAAILWASPQSAYAQDKPQKVVLRFVADLPPPPHPAGLAMKYFAERLPQVIPGSEARLYYAGALYTIPEAIKVFGVGHMSFGMGIGGRNKRFAKPSDFEGRKLRSMGPVENASLHAWN